MADNHIDVPLLKDLSPTISFKGHSISSDRPDVGTIELSKLPSSITEIPHQVDDKKLVEFEAIKDFLNKSFDSSFPTLSFRNPPGFTKFFPTPDQKFVLIKGGTAEVRELKGRRPIASANVPAGEITSLAFTENDGKNLIVLGDSLGKVHFYTYPELAEVKKGLEVHSFPIHTIRYNPKTRKVYTLGNTLAEISLESLEPALVSNESILSIDLLDENLIISTNNGLLIIGKEPRILSQEKFDYVRSWFSFIAAGNNKKIKV